MASAALLVGSLAMSALQTGAQNRAARQQQTAANEATQRQVDELQRQTERDSEVAAEEKSDRARELDREVGSIVAAGADGGATNFNLAASGGAAGAVAGLDIARIESNRRERAESRFSSATSAVEENKARQQQTKNTISSNNLSFFASAVSTVGGGFAPGGAFAGSGAVSTPTPPPMDLQWSS